MHLPHSRQRLLLRQAVGAHAEAQALAAHAHRAAAGQSRAGWGKREGEGARGWWPWAGGASWQNGKRHRFASMPRLRARCSAAMPRHARPGHACHRHRHHRHQPANHQPAHLETMMTLKPCALRSRAVSTMLARLDRLRLPCSARMRLEVPTLMTCRLQRRIQQLPPVALIHAPLAAALTPLAGRLLHPWPLPGPPARHTAGNARPDSPHPQHINHAANQRNHPAKCRGRRPVSRRSRLTRGGGGRCHAQRVLQCDCTARILPLTTHGCAVGLKNWLVERVTAGLLIVAGAAAACPPPWP